MPNTVSTLVFYGRHEPKRAGEEKGSHDAKPNQVVTWLHQIETTFLGHPHVDQWVKTTYALRHLRGPAEEFWSAYSGNDATVSLPWPEFKQLMVERFFDAQAEKLKLLNFFHAFKQGSTEALYDAVTRFNSCVHRARSLPTDIQRSLPLHDAYLVAQFRHGLRPDIRNLLETRAPVHLNLSYNEVTRLAATLYSTFTQPGSCAQARVQAHSGRMSDDSDAAQVNAHDAQVLAAEAGPHTTCFGCGRKGHFANDCPNKHAHFHSARQGQANYGRPVNDHRRAAESSSRGRDGDKRRHEPKWRGRKGSNVQKRARDLPARDGLDRSRRSHETRRDKSHSVNATRARHAKRRERRDVNNRGRSRTRSDSSGGSDASGYDAYDSCSSYSSSNSETPERSRSRSRHAVHSTIGEQHEAAQRAPEREDRPAKKRASGGSEPRERRRREDADSEYEGAARVRSSSTRKVSGKE